MSVRVLVTGGAGFIGSHIVERLLELGMRVIILDNLEPQVHGLEAGPPRFLADHTEFIVGDIRDRGLVESLVRRSDVVVHMASAVGLAQSMYQMERFADVNCRGTAILLEACAQPRSTVAKVLLASTMSLYGEGRCICPNCGAFDPALRSESQLAAKNFDVLCPRCQAVAVPAATPEDARLNPTTVYAVTKRDQEELLLVAGDAYSLPVTALRLFNVYGPRQSLSNPYTGVAAIFSSRMLNRKQPIVFEDGNQTRAFTHVTDVAEAFVRALQSDRVDGKVLNVGAGRSYTLHELGRLLAGEIGVEWEPEITGLFRKGDIRHCMADTSRLQRELDFTPRVAFESGVKDLVHWIRTQSATDYVDRALTELKDRGLVH